MIDKLPYGSECDSTNSDEADKVGDQNPKIRELDYALLEKEILQEIREEDSGDMDRPSNAE